MEKNSFDIDSVLSDTENEPIIAIGEHISKLSAYGDSLQNLNEPQKVFFFVDYLEMEINNGGFNQYFYNSSGAFAHETVEALKAINAFETAKILEDAISLWPDKKVPRDETERKDFLDQSAERVDPLMEELDNRYFAYPDPVGTLLIDYVKNNNNMFK